MDHFPQSTIVLDCVVKNSDYTCCPDEQKTEEFWAYLADRKYDLRPINEYADFIKGAGFDVTATDQSEWFTKILNMEMEKLESMKDEFMAHHSEKVFPRSEFFQVFNFLSCIFYLYFRF